MRFYLTFFLFAVFSCVSTANAQDTRQKQLLGLHYIPATYESLSRVSWRFGVNPLSSDRAIDYYLQITDCPLYKDYFENDFLWQRIREGKRREIKYYAPNYPDRFEMIGAIELGRYDFASSAFVVPEKFRLNKAGFLEIPVLNNFKNECVGFNKRYAEFPPFIGLAADNPFDLNKIPVPPNEAKPLIERLSQKKYINAQSDRIVVVRVRVHMSGIKEHDKDSVLPRLIFKGQLDEIAVFEDLAMTKVIWQKNFKALD
jgi:hypothetical protein